MDRNMRLPMPEYKVKVLEDDVIALKCGNCGAWQIVRLVDKERV